MTATTEQLKRIQEKVQQLVKQNAGLQKEYNKLKQDLHSSRDQSSLLEKNSESLKQQVNVLRLNAGEMSEADKKEIENRINSYLKEIDRCIAALGA